MKAHFAESSDDYFLLDTKTFVSALTISREVFELFNAPDKEKKFKKEYLKNTNDSIGYANAVSVCKHFCLEFLKNIAALPYIIFRMLKLQSIRLTICPHSIKR